MFFLGNTIEKLTGVKSDFREYVSPCSDCHDKIALVGGNGHRNRQWHRYLNVGFTFVPLQKPGIIEKGSVEIFDLFSNISSPGKASDRPVTSAETPFARQPRRNTRELLWTKHFNRWKTSRFAFSWCYPIRRQDLSRFIQVPYRVVNAINGFKHESNHAMFSF